MAKTEKFHYEVGIRINRKNLKERCSIIEQGIESEAWKGKKLALAKRRLTHYRYYEKLLKKQQMKKKKKKNAHKENVNQSNAATV